MIQKGVCTNLYKSLLVSIICLIVLVTCFSCNKKTTKPTDEGLTEAEKLAIVETHNSIAATADSILLTDDVVSGFTSLLPSYKSHPNVEDAWLTNNGLYVKYKKAGIVSWVIASNVIIPPWESSPVTKLTLSKPTDLKGAEELIGNNKICIINQQYHDEFRLYCKDAVAYLSNLFQKNGYEVTVKNGEDANLDFFDSELKNFGVIFNISHGTYDGKFKLTLLATGEEMNIVNTILHTDPLDWITLKVLYSTVKEKRNGKLKAVHYYAISQKYIDSKYSVGDFPHSVIYLVACQALKSDILAQIFNNKGVGVTIGWDEFNCRGTTTGKHLLEAMLSGVDLLTAFNSLPSEEKFDKCSVAEGANLTYYPKEGGSIQFSENETDVNIAINSPVDGKIYYTGVLTLSGYLENASTITHGTVELNDTVRTLTKIGDVNFTQPIAIKIGKNTIKVNCYGILNNGRSCFASKTITVFGFSIIECPP